MAVDIRKHSDIVLAIFVVAVAAMLLVPLPTPLLDVLIVLNISFSLLLLLVGLYLPNALALLSFPSLLLLTTLFRLSLNVASSRLILSQGHAGDVIQAFGTFLVGGELAVGIIIFTIITIVNFVVIARGAGRVSEVAARFALDALPGKQMAIDADVRAGLISASQAQERREDLRRESQLYGAMDGSMKFVQGDAIAGFFIILTNIFGGIYIGVTQGMSFSEAIQSYTILTVGDGLVTQIPALLISICAGIVVTRVSSRDDATLSSDVGRQIFRRPETVILAGVLLFIMALFPGLPAFPFLVVSFCFIGVGIWLRRSRVEVETHLPMLSPMKRSLMGPSVGLPGPDSARESNQPPIVLAFDDLVLYRLYVAETERCLSAWRQLQEDVYTDSGLRIPDFQVVADPNLSAASYTISSRGTLMERGTLPLDCVAIEMNPGQAELFGLQVAAEIDHPLSGVRMFWCRDAQSVRSIAEAAEIRALSFFEFVALKAVALCISSPEDVLSLTEVHQEVKAIEKQYPGLMEETLDREFVNTARLTQIMHELVREGVNVRDVRQIIESIAAYCAAYAKSELQPSDFDLQEIVSFIRKHRRRQLLGKLLTERKSLRVITLSEDAETALSTGAGVERASARPEGAPLEATTLRNMLDPLKARGIWPVSLLCKGDLREAVYNALKALSVSMPVVTQDELDPQVVVEPVGVWHGGELAG